MKSARARPVALVLGVSLAVLTGCGPKQHGQPEWQSGQTTAGASSPATGGPKQAADGVISLSATGDIIMGNAPDRIPADGGKGFFDRVRSLLGADLVMGNLEEPLTEDTGRAKCGPGSTDCHQFRMPPEYAAHLRDGGFQLLNQANNHAHDFGPTGYQNTQKALAEQGLRHTGAPGEITVVTVRGVRVAVVGFSPYGWNNSSLNIRAAKKLVEKAGAQSDLVVVQVHMGAEGADKTVVRPGTEMFVGENRGDPVAFSHAMIDAGADLVVGHGPHVLRGFEFHRGRLIAYSLGNFAGGEGTLSNSGRLGWGGVLRVSLKRDGTWVGGTFLPTYMNGSGRPTPDKAARGLNLVKECTSRDFPATGPRFTAGEIAPPDAR